MFTRGMCEDCEQPVELCHCMDSYDFSPYFDRFDICEAYYLVEVDYNVGGWLHERKSNVRRGVARGYIGEATHVQLSDMGFKPKPNLSYKTLSDNGRAIYNNLVMTCKLEE